MTDELKIGGSKYVSATDAASKWNFTRDYVTRLCRAGKVRGRRIGKNWYIDQDSFETFLILQEHAKKVRHAGLARERVRAYHTEELRVPLDTSSSGALSQVKDTSSVAQPHVLKALSVHSSKLVDSASNLAYVPSGFGSSILQTANAQAHTITPIVEILHKLLALSLTLMIVFGTYTLFNPRAAQFAIATSHEQALALADHPQAAAAGLFANFQFADLVRGAAAAVRDVAYAIAFPNHPAATSSSIALSVEPYRASSTGSQLSPTQTPALLRSAIAQSTSSSPIIERVVVRQTEQPIINNISNGVSESELTAKLDTLNTDLLSRISSMTSSNSSNLVRVFQAASYSVPPSSTDALTEGSSNLYFTNSRAQGAISVAGSPLTYASGVVGIDQANDSQPGYLSSADWNTFNEKVSSSSLATYASGNQNWSILDGALTPTTTLGVLLNASSTIGDGTQAGGLTISGGATTTGNAYFGGNVGIGTTNPGSKLEVQGLASAQYFNATSSTNYSTFTGGLISQASSTVAGDFTATGNATFGGTLTVTGLCVAADTKLRRRRRRRRADGTFDDEYEYDEVDIIDIEEGDEIQSLDEKTGKLVWSRVRGLFFMGTKQTYRITTEDGREIRTTANHPYLIKNAKGKWLKHRSPITGAGWAAVSQLREGDEIAVRTTENTALPPRGLEPLGHRMTSLTPYTKRVALASDTFRTPWTIRFDTSGTSYAATVPSTTWMSSEDDASVENIFVQPPAGIEPAAHGIRSPRQYQTDGLSSSYHALQMKPVLSWSKIVSIEPVAEEEVYDIEVEGTHNFIGNGIVAHNTAIFNGGLLDLASTTIGNGTQAGGLTISGGATTTGNAYFAGTINTNGAIIPSSGTQNITGILSATGAVSAAYFGNSNFTSGGNGFSASTFNSAQYGPGVAVVAKQYNSGYTGDLIEAKDSLNNILFNVNTSGNVGIGTTNPGSKLEVQGLASAQYFNATSTTDYSTFSGGLLSLASSTIGNGTQAGGLTVSGGATTTGNALFGGMVDVGTTTALSHFSDAVLGLYKDLTDTKIGLTSTWTSSSWTCGDPVSGGPGDTNTYATVLGEDGNCWLATNLGTTHVPTSYSDSAGYGALYQWGRLTDGHQITTSATTNTLATSIVPGNPDFILSPSSPYDWVTPQDNSLWQGSDGGTNAICPAGFRLPTSAEWATWSNDASLTSGATGSSNGTTMCGSSCLAAAYNTNLKLPAAGFRDNGSGALGYQGSNGLYWSSSPSGTYASYLFFLASSVHPAATDHRAYGLAVRCIKDPSSVIAPTPVDSNWTVGIKNSDQSFRISSSTSLGTSDAFTILSGGNTGIGNSTPAYKLDVNGAGHFSSFVDADHFVATSTTATSTFAGGLNVTGFVGIGTTSPAYLLDVATSTTNAIVARFTNGTGSCTINPTSGSLGCSSDERLKKDIVSFASSTLALASSTPTAESVFDRVLALRPVYYNWLSEATGTPPHTGFIAQEVSPLFPDLVATDTASGYYTLNYAGFAPYFASVLHDVGSIAGEFKANLIAWLGDAGNGIRDLYASVIHSQEVDTQKLCVSDSTGASTCVTKAQLDALLAAVGTAGGGGSAGAAASSGGDSSGAAATSTPPVLKLSGNDPATVSIGATYNDLGATITGPTADLNLGIRASVDGATSTAMSAVAIDTSVAGTHTIEYSATDQSGLVGTASRTVIVSAPTDTTTTTSATTTSAISTSTPETMGTIAPAMVPIVSTTTATSTPATVATSTASTSTTSTVL